MSELRKARLGEIGSGDGPQEGSNWVDVQFNPTSLRVQISNRTAGGQQAGAQARQRPGTGEMQVSFDLVFDTADEGTTDEPVDVLKRTASVERFVRPRGTQPGQEAPPRVAFEWGSFQVQGVMESANIDLDFFDASGVPLRAKVSVTIKGQDPRWAYEPDPRLAAGGQGSASGDSGARQAASGPAALQAPPGGAGGLPAGAPGTQGAKGPVQQLLQAMPGESLAQLAARAGVAPSAWRALAPSGGGAVGSQGLALGQEVSVPAGLGGGQGGGLATGRQTAGRDPGRTASQLALTTGTKGGGGSSASSVGASSTPAVQQGQALAALGGVGDAIQQRHDARHQRGAADSLRAFGQAPGATEATDDRPWGAGVPLRRRLGAASLGGGARGSATFAATGATASTAMASRPATPSSIRSSTKATTKTTGVASRGCGCRGRRR